MTLQPSKNPLFLDGNPLFLDNNRLFLLAEAVAPVPVGGLRSRIDTALGADEDFAHSEWGAPVLDGIPDRPAVMTRWGGRQVVNGFLRHVVDVVMLYNMARRSDAYDGLEEAVDTLTEALYEVDDCYPELLPVAPEHGFKVTEKGQNAYVGAIIRCVGE